MFKTYVAFGFLLVATPVHAQSLGEKSGVNSVLGVSPTMGDFVKDAASSDMFEIQSSQLALQQAIDQGTKQFATRMIADHQKTTSDIRGMLSRGAFKADIPSAMLPTHQALFEKLKGLKGEDFTKRYHDEQVTAHKQAVSLYERYSHGGDNAGLKDWTAKTLPTLQHHLKMAQDMNK